MKMKLKKLRVRLLIFALLSSLYGAIYNGFFSGLTLFQGYEALEVLKFTQIFTICYYFTYKASKLLPNRERNLKILRIIFYFGFTMLFGLSIFVGVNIASYVNSGDTLNPNLSYEVYFIFETFTVAPIVLMLCFIIILSTIQIRLEQLPRVTDLEFKLYQLQLSLIKRLSLVVYLCLFLTTLQFILETLKQVLNVESISGIFSPNHYVLNALVYFTKKFIASCSPSMVVIALFTVFHWKANERNKNDQSINDSNS
jgi:uncharacterized membrane protein